MARTPKLLFCLVLLMGVLFPGPAASPAASTPKPQLVLLLAPYDQPCRDPIAMTLAWMCKDAGVDFDVYYAADHKEGGLFSQHGSNVIGGHHATRIGRALSSYRATVVRLGGVSLFETLIRQGAEKVIDAPAELPALYLTMAKHLGRKLPRAVTVFGPADLATAVCFPECVYRKTLAVPLDLPAGQIRQLKEAGVKTAWTVIKADADLSAWKAAGFEIKAALDLSAADPNLTMVERWIGQATAIDTLEPLLASYLLPLSVREGRLVLTYKDWDQAVKRRDQMLKLTAAKGQHYAFGRWYGDPQLIPLAERPVAYNVVEPNRQILTVFAQHPVKLPQPAKSWLDLEPGDETLRAWAREGKILATWILHSGELSHDDAVLTFYDWSAMTKMKIGSGVHWQRYYYDPDAVEQIQVPVDEGGVLGLVEPVLHSAGAGIIWETAGDPVRNAALMADSRRRIAALAGERFAPRGVYCFGDIEGWKKTDPKPAAAQIALWKAVKNAGFDYLVTSVLPGDSRILYRDGDFVVLNQAGRWCGGSPFMRGFPDTYAATEKKLVAAGKPGWMVGALDSPIHGSPIYLGHPYGGKDPQPRIFDYYDYLQKGGVTGKVISATPHTIARYARIIANMETPQSEGNKP